MSASDVDQNEAFSATRFRSQAEPLLLATDAAGSTVAEFGDHTADMRLKFAMPGGPPKKAAVLIPVVDRGDEATVLLTQRTDHLPSHPGQISFPGGKVDDEDATAMNAALREAEEEIGLTTSHIDVIGNLNPYLSNTGFLIVPVVSIVTPGFKLVPNEGEVADIFEVPLKFLMSSRNHQKVSVMLRGQERMVFAMPYHDRYIWGVTAGILRLLYETVYV